MNCDDEQNPSLKDSEKQVSCEHFGISCSATDSTPKQANGQPYNML